MTVLESIDTCQFMDVMVCILENKMKVSITFDKEVKDSNKKQWVREIQTVVDKLNSRNKDAELRLDKKPELRDRPRIPSSDKRLLEREAESIKKSSVSAQVEKKERHVACRAESENSQAASEAGLILNQLIRMQEQMAERFGKIQKVLGTMAQKMNSVESRVSKLQANSQRQRQNDREFEEQFIKVVEKYGEIDNNSDNLIGSSNSCDSMSKYLVDTADTYFKPPKPRLVLKKTH